MTVVHNVEKVLQMGQRFRDNDKLLLLAIWHTEGLRLTDEQRHMFLTNCTSAETITRVRRALKVDYPASETIDQVRYNRFKEYKQGAIL